jgi:tetratricopeptide (TPR) repeat protein
MSPGPERDRVTTFVGACKEAGADLPTLIECATLVLRIVREPPLRAHWLCVRGVAHREHASSPDAPELGDAIADLTSSLALLEPSPQGPADATTSALAADLIVSNLRRIALIDRSAAFRKKGEVARALADADRGVKEFPARPDCYLERARVRILRSDRAGVREDLDTCERVGESRDAFACLELADFHYDLGDREDALRLYERYLAFPNRALDEREEPERRVRELKSATRKPGGD